jgi:hypothetical protein
MPLPAATLPSSSIVNTALSPWSNVLTLESDWVYPSRTMGISNCGKAESGRIVCSPVHGMLNTMLCAAHAVPLETCIALASMIAWRSDPLPASFVLLTVNVAACVADAAASDNPTNAMRAAALRVSLMVFT